MANILLIDGDIVIYQQACINQQEIDWGDGEPSLLLTPEKAQANVDDAIARYTKKLEAKWVYVCLGSTKNFRKKLNPKYKANRKGQPKPVLRMDLIEHVSMNYNTISWDTLEADDVMGIMSTGPLLEKLGTPVIVSIDKDLRQIPGKLYNPLWPDLGIQTISPEEADHTFYMQVLTGDTTDGYYGVPGIGPKKAKKLLAQAEWGYPEEFWAIILAAYEAKGLTEEDALLNARMARILRWGDYDYDKKEVILWKP